MIKARHTWSGRSVCRLFSGFYLERTFRDIQIIGPTLSQEGAVLLLANHFCWWDGFIQYRLNEQCFHRLYHVMMLEDELIKHPILNKAGAYSIRPKSRDILRSLQYTLELLENPENLVLLFPQGRIESMHTNTIRFEQGIDYLLNQLPASTQIIFNVNLVDFHAGKKPTLYIFYHPFTPLQTVNGENAEIAYNEFYKQCKDYLQKIWI